MKNFGKILVALMLVMSMTLMMAACGADKEDVADEGSVTSIESPSNGLTKPAMPTGSSEADKADDNSAESDSAESEPSEEGEEGGENGLNENYFQSSVML